MALHQILNPVVLRDLARSWIREDLSSFDLQGLAAGDKEIVATIYCKSSGVLAGVPFLNAIFDELKCTPNWFYKEGEWLEHSSPINGHGPSPPVEVAYVGGQAKNVLLAERLALNVLARCSGVATKARRVKMAVDDMGWKGTIAGTRKTTPGFRMVEKYGLLVGGVSTHRYDMSGMVMIKDNHVNLCGGSIEKAVNMVKGVASFMQKIEVETRNMEEAQAALRAGADIIMLDNFKLPVRLSSALS